MTDAINKATGEVVKGIDLAEIDPKDYLLNPTREQLTSAGVADLPPADIQDTDSIKITRDGVAMDVLVGDLKKYLTP